MGVCVTLRGSEPARYLPAVVPRQRDLVFNVVVTGGLFGLMQSFVASLMHHSSARFRLVTNACTAASIEEMEQFAREHDDQIVEVLDVSPETMVGHGEALERVLARRDDGAWFCFVDADIKARGPWLEAFIELLDDVDVVSSGKEVWTDDNVVAEEHLGIGLGGRHFYHPNGFVYGCPHLGIYRRSSLDDTRERWGVGLGHRGDDLGAEATRRLDEAGHLYRMYDTAKVVNILMQLDGYTLVHEENPQLVHIGGLSHYLAPSEWDIRTGDGVEPGWTRTRGVEARAAVARYAAAVLRAATSNQDVPDVPSDVDPNLEERLQLVRVELVDMVARHHGATQAPGSDLTTVGRERLANDGPVSFLDHRSVGWVLADDPHELTSNVVEALLQIRVEPVRYRRCVASLGGGNEDLGAVARGAEPIGVPVGRPVGVHLAAFTRAAIGG